MCTITLSYDHNNALARRKLAALLRTGLFVQTEGDIQPVSEADEIAHHEEVESFLYASKKNMANIISRYL